MKLYQRRSDFRAVPVSDQDLQLVQSLDQQLYTDQSDTATVDRLVTDQLLVLDSASQKLSSNLYFPA